MHPAAVAATRQRLWGLGETGLVSRVLRAAFGSPTCRHRRTAHCGFSTTALSNSPSPSSPPRPSTFTPSKGGLPSSARVVIIGGGVVGCSVAFHLSRLGWGGETVIVESGQLGCGTTWHAAGLVGQMRATASETRLSGVYGAQLYAKLEAETGVPTGFRQTGSITVARTAERWTLLSRQASRAKAFNIDAHLISPSEAHRMWPYMRYDDLQGALWLPGDGSITSTDLTASLAAGARQGGVVIHERTRVVGMELDEGKRARDRRVRRVLTEHGAINCEIVVNCGGQWAHHIGLMAGVAVPLHSAEHFYVVTDPLSPVVPTRLPVLRDPDSYNYYREWSGGLVMGGFEPKAKPCFHDSIPANFEFSLLPEDWDQFEPLLTGALHRVPLLATAGVRMVNGPESFTPDNSYLLGESSTVRHFYIAAGMNSSGIASAGGAGKALAEWIVNDKPTSDLWTVDVRRFDSWQGNKKFLRDRVVEVLGLHYSIPWPQRELTSARPIRRSPFYQLLLEAGAQYGSKFGWERPNYFLPPLSTAPSPSPSQPQAHTPDSVPLYSFGRQRWFHQVQAEHLACRTAVALVDASSQAKFLLQGKDCLSYLQRLCCHEMNVVVGSVLTSQMLNDEGGIEADLTVTRLALDRWMMISGTAQAVRDKDWMERGMKDGEGVVVTDVTSAWSVLQLIGPQSSQLLERATERRVDFSSTAFPFCTAQEIHIGYGFARAHRHPSASQDGFDLFIPTEFSLSVYQAILDSATTDPAQGSAPSIRLSHAGFYAMESLRLEQGRPVWGVDLSPSSSPLEAGMGSGVGWDKSGGFRGREALWRQRRDGLKRRLLSVVMEDREEGPDWLLLGGEPVWRDGELVGYIGSAAYGYSMKGSVGLAWVQKGNGEVIESEWLDERVKWEVELCGVRRPVTIRLTPPVRSHAVAHKQD